jgi:ribonuclease Z
MAKVIILGTASAVAYEGHENTHMVLMGEQHTVLVDCVGSPAIRLKQAGVNFDQITDLVLTHFHPDHVSGVPLLLMDMWLLGRDHPLNIHGLDTTMTRVKAMLDLYDWESWPDFFPVAFHALPDQGVFKAVDHDDLLIQTAPVQHLIPTIGLRAHFRKEDFSVAYSCDTEPCQNVVTLASDADVLIHEAAGGVKGHSSPRQAGEIAQQANARALYLIHYPEKSYQDPSTLLEVQKVYSHKVSFAEDFMTIEVER